MWTFVKVLKCTTTISYAVYYDNDDDDDEHEGDDVDNDVFMERFTSGII